MTLDEDDVPIAYSMLQLSRESAGSNRSHFHQYVFAWTAFNNVYATLSDRSGLSPELLTDNAGRTLTELDGSVRIPKVKAPTERDQLKHLRTMIGQDTKILLLAHPHIKFFAFRTPSWEGAKLAVDIRGQALNGVLNVSRTVSAEEPVWSPIDVAAYERYLATGGAEERELLVRQVLNLLYTVRNNLVHGGKRGDDANDATVLEMALPLLMIIVDSFME